MFQGPREQVLQQYAQNSYGKIQKVLGPFPYDDGTNDVYYEHITKLHNDKIASALMKHGAGTLVKFATSPHIFAYEGNDIDGWHNYEPAGIVLVSNPAYGEQSIITKSCHGQEIKCYNELAPENKIAAVTQLISSFIDSSTSNLHTMDNNNPSGTNTVTEQVDNAAKDLTGNSLQVKETVTEQPKIITTDEIKPINSNTQSEQNEEVKILRQKILDMENEKKTEILSDLWSVISDEKERSRTIKEYFDTTDLNQAKALKLFADRLAPLYKKQGEMEATKQFKDAQEKELKAYKNNKIASSSYKFQLPGEPKEPEKDNNEPNKIASTKKVGELAEFQSLLRGWGGMK